MKHLLVSLIFLMRSVVFPILLFSSISLHCSLKKAYLSLLLFGTLHSDGYIFPFLLCLLLLFFSQLFISFLKQPFCLAALLFLGMILVTASFTMLKVKVKSVSPVWLFATPWTVAYQAPLSIGFHRQEYWSGLPLPSTNTHLQLPFSGYILQSLLGQDIIMYPIPILIDFHFLYERLASLLPDTELQCVFSHFWIFVWKFC